MSDDFKQYIISLYQDIPQEVYEGLLSVFCIGLVVFIAWKGFKTGFRYSAILLLVGYIFLIFCSTIIFRATGEIRQYDFHPFWSYDRPELLVENIMNVVVFIPMGFLFGITVKKIKWWQVLLIGGCISSSIEFLQLLLKKGVSEFDDIMHNTLGCMMGYGMYALIKFCYVKISKRGVTVK